VAALAALLSFAGIGGAGVILELRTSQKRRPYATLVALVISRILINNFTHGTLHVYIVGQAHTLALPHKGKY